MANRPAVLLADEPTGNLDEETASAVFATLVQAARETSAALLVATHNPELAGRADATCACTTASSSRLSRPAGVSALSRARSAASAAPAR